MVENSQKIVLIYDLFEDSEEVCFEGEGVGCSKLGIIFGRQNMNTINFATIPERRICHNLTHIGKQNESLVQSNKYNNQKKEKKIHEAKIHKLNQKNRSIINPITAK